MGKASINGAKFGALLNTKFSDRDYASRKQVAADLDLGSSTLGEFIRLERNFPPDLIPALVGATDDLDYIRFFTRPLGLGIFRIPRLREGADPVNIIKRMGAAIKQFGALCQRVGSATDEDSEGGAMITPAEYREIASAYEMALEEMTAAVVTARMMAGVKGEDV